MHNPAEAVPGDRCDWAGSDCLNKRKRHPSPPAADSPRAKNDGARIGPRETLGSKTGITIALGEAHASSERRHADAGPCASTVAKTVDDASC